MSTTKVEPVTWYRKGDDDEEGQASWDAYDSAQCRLIERAYQKSQKTLKLNENYKINFKELIQFRSDDPNRWRSIKRGGTQDKDDGDQRSMNFMPSSSADVSMADEEQNDAAADESEFKPTQSSDEQEAEYNQPPTDDDEDHKPKRRSSNSSKGSKAKASSTKKRSKPTKAKKAATGKRKASISSSSSSNKTSSNNKASSKGKKKKTTTTTVKHDDDESASASDVDAASQSLPPNKKAKFTSDTNAMADDSGISTFQVDLDQLDEQAKQHDHQSNLNEEPLPALSPETDYESKFAQPQDKNAIAGKPANFVSLPAAEPPAAFKASMEALRKKAQLAQPNSETQSKPKRSPAKQQTLHAVVSSNAAAAAATTAAPSLESSSAAQPKAMVPPKRSSPPIQTQQPPAVVSPKPQAVAAAPAVEAATALASAAAAQAPKASASASDSEDLTQLDKSELIKRLLFAEASARDDKNEIDYLLQQNTELETQVAQLQQQLTGSRPTNKQQGESTAHPATASATTKSAQSNAANHLAMPSVESDSDIISPRSLDASLYFASASASNTGMPPLEHASSGNNTATTQSAAHTNAKQPQSSARVTFECKLLDQQISKRGAVCAACALHDGTFAVGYDHKEFIDIFSSASFHSKSDTRLPLRTIELNRIVKDSELEIEEIDDLEDEIIEASNAERCTAISVVDSSLGPLLLAAHGQMLTVHPLASTTEKPILPRLIAAGDGSIICAITPMLDDENTVVLGLTGPIPQLVHLRFDCKPRIKEEQLATIALPAGEIRALLRVRHNRLALGGISFEKPKPKNQRRYGDELEEEVECGALLFVDVTSKGLAIVHPRNELYSDASGVRCNDLALLCNSVLCAAFEWCGRGERHLALYKLDLSGLDTHRCNAESRQMPDDSTYTSIMALDNLSPKAINASAASASPSYQLLALTFEGACYHWDCSQLMKPSAPVWTSPGDAYEKSQDRHAKLIKTFQVHPLPLTAAQVRARTKSSDMSDEDIYASTSDADHEVAAAEAAAAAYEAAGEPNEDACKLVCVPALGAAAATAADSQPLSSGCILAFRGNRQYALWR